MIRKKGSKEKEEGDGGGKGGRLGVFFHLRKLVQALMERVENLKETPVPGF